MDAYHVSRYQTWLAEAGHDQRIETFFLSLVKRKNTFPACQDVSTHLYVIRVLQHHIHDADGELIDVTAQIHVVKVQDAADPVTTVFIGLDKQVEVIEVPMY